ncbi:MAG: cytochrome P450 [Chroococcidiopsis sp.]
MSYLTAAEQFDPSNPRFTTEQFTLLAQMPTEASVTFLPVLNVYAVTRWQEVHDVLSDWSDALVAFQIPGLPVEVQVSSAQGLRALDNYVREAIAQKAASPDEGLIASLVASRTAGENDLSDDELVADFAIVFFAGHETTINKIANAFHSLLAKIKRTSSTGRELERLLCN